MTERSYYGQPIIKRPVWTWEIPWYFLSGGVAGASSLLASGARLKGDEATARTARAVAAGAAAISPALLISDLGRPDRFHHMLRVIRPSSPMNMGSWLLSGYVPAAIGAWLLGRSKNRLQPLQRLAEAIAAAFGPTMTTYTAVLLADTSVPAWHDARRELPFVFASSSAAGAGAILVMTRSVESSTAATVAVLGAVTEQVATKVMEKRLGDIGRPYREGPAGRLARWAQGLSWAGVGLAFLGRRRRTPAVLGGAMILAGAVCERWAIFKAGFESADDPEYTVGPQKARLGKS